jgi:hypothetical protein
MTDDIDEMRRKIAEVIDAAASYIVSQAHQIETLRQDRAELRRALHEVSYMLNSLEVLPSAMTKTTSDTLVRLNLGGFND